MESGEHMPDKPTFVNELIRVAAPGGRIIIVTWCHRDLEAGESEGWGAGAGAGEVMGTGAGEGAGEDAGKASFQRASRILLRARTPVTHQP